MGETDHHRRSNELGLNLVDERGTLKLVDPKTGRALPDLQEAEAARREVEALLSRSREENCRLREKLAPRTRRQRP